jgi:class 3 adenylate cyclase
MASVLAKLTGKEEIELPRALAYPPVLGEGAPWVRAYPLNYLKQILARDPKTFNNKVVLVGLKSPLRDMHRISFVSFDAERGNLPGVVIHAHALAQILNAAALMVYGIVTSMVYASTSLFLPLILPSIALGLGLMISALAEGGQLRRQRSAVRKVFSQYVPKQVVDQLIDKPTQSLLAGHRVTITCLFTDIAGFTSLAEKMDPVQLVELMNRYFDGVTRIIHKHEGTVDKFIGDAVLAFFGAPLEQPDHANRAVAAGIEIHQFSTDLRERLAKEGIDLGETRVGIHSGEAVVGNIGGELRQNYTALGDAVNLASRLEGANRYLGSRVCISERRWAWPATTPPGPLETLWLKGARKRSGSMNRLRSSIKAKSS